MPSILITPAGIAGSLTPGILSPVIAPVGITGALVAGAATAVFAPVGIVGTSLTVPVLAPAGITGTSLSTAVLAPAGIVGTSLAVPVLAPAGITGISTILPVVAPAGIAGGALSTSNLDVFAYTPAFDIANTGRIQLHEWVTFPDAFTVTGAPAMSLINISPAVTMSTGAYSLTGFDYRPTISYSVATVFAFAPAFWGRAIYRPTVVVADASALFVGFVAAPVWQLGYAGAGLSTTTHLTGFWSGPTTARDAGSATGTLALFSHYYCAGGTDPISTGLTATLCAGFYMQNVSAITGTITTLVGIELEALTRGGTNLSIRARGASVNMRHEGPARFGGSDVSAVGGSILQVDGGLTLKQTAATNADYTALLTDCIIEFPTITAARVMNLPTAASAAVGKIYIIKKTAGVFTVTIEPNGAETIDGATNSVMPATAQAARIIYCTGTTWFTVGAFL